MKTRANSRLRFALYILLTLSLVACAPGSAAAQERGNPQGEWRYIGGDAGHTRYSPLDQINATNFEDLEQAWVWRGDNYGPTVDYLFRSTPNPARKRRGVTLRLCAFALKRN